MNNFYYFKYFKDEVSIFKYALKNNLSLKKIIKTKKGFKGLFQNKKTKIEEYIPAEYNKSYAFLGRQQFNIKDYDGIKNKGYQYEGIKVITESNISSKLRYINKKLGGF
jgi:hypothetical protein